MAVVVVLLGAMTFMAGFGAGFNRRVTAPRVASLNAAPLQREADGDDPVAT